MHDDKSYWHTNADIFADFYDSGERALLGMLVTRFLRVRLKIVADLVLPRLESGQWVVDVGCGDGPHMALAASHGANVVGIDYSRQMIELNRARQQKQNRPMMPLIQGNIENLPLPDNRFDWLFSIGVLDYVSNLDRSLSELARVVKTGGFLILTMPRRPSPFAISRWPIISGLRHKLIGLPPLIHIHTRDEFIHCLAAHNFEIVTLTDIQKTMWLTLVRYNGSPA